MQVKICKYKLELWEILRIVNSKNGVSEYENNLMVDIIKQLKSIEGFRMDPWKTLGDIKVSNKIWRKKHTP